MVQRYAAAATVILGLLTIVACDSNSGRDGSGRSGSQEAPDGVVQVARADQPAAAAEGKRKGFDPIVIRHGRVTVIGRQDVPSQRDGAVRKILVNEGDEVEKDQELVLLDARLAQADVAIKVAKQLAAEADFKAAIKTRDEAAKRVVTVENLRKVNAISPEEVRSAQLTWDRYVLEAVSKDQAIKLAGEELNQAKVVLEMHTIKSSTKGVVKAIFKKPGESIKSLDTVMQLHNVDSVRVEGLADVQYLPRLKKGMKVVIEPMRAVSPLLTMRTYSEINGVAVSNDRGNPLVVAGCEDSTARVWDRFYHQERLVLRHPAAVRAVACTGPKAKANLLLTGAADGKPRLWDLAATGDQAARELSGQGPHKGAVSCVAFSPDGQLCATGGEDKEIYLWDVASGGPRYKLPSTHRGPITTLQFVHPDQLLSAARDGTVQLWQLGEQEAQNVNAHFPRRSGDVASLGVSPDGKRLLFDQGKTLCIMTLPQGFTQSFLQNVSGTGNFTTFALFAPHGRLIATTGGSDGRVQLWRTPDAKLRGYEIRQLATIDRCTPTCAAFAPDASFLVAGCRERQVFVWPVPTSNEEIDEQLTADITFIDREVTAASRQVRIWAELPNRNGLLSPGLSATMVAYDEK